MLGSIRQTLDIDFTTDLESVPAQTFETVVQQVAQEMDLDVEPASIAEFVPLPQNAATRRRFIGRFGAAIRRIPIGKDKQVIFEPYCYKVNREIVVII